MASEDDIVNAMVAAVAADGNLTPDVVAALGDLNAAAWFDTGTPEMSEHGLRAMMRGLATVINGGGGSPDHIQVELSSSFNFAAGSTTFKAVPWDADLEAQGITRVGTAITLPGGPGLYLFSYSLDTGAPGSGTAISEARWTAGGAPIPGTTSLGPPTGALGPTHLSIPGVLASMSGGEVVEVEMRSTVAVATWVATRGTAQVRKVG